MKLKLLIGIILLLTAMGNVNAQSFVDLTMTNLDNPAPGYLFLGPFNNYSVCIYDNMGKVAYYKTLPILGSTFTALKTLENGQLVFFSQTTKKWYLLNQSLDVVDTVYTTSPYNTNFHSFCLSPQGHYVVIGDNFKTVDMSQKVPGGKTNALVCDMVIQELDNNRNVVFQWSCMDHIDVTQAAEDVNLTNTGIDPYHINSVNFDNDGNLIVSLRNCDEVIKVNHTTGNIMWIIGGSKSRGNQFTFIGDNVAGFNGFSHQHDAKRLGNGNLLLFDNGNLKPVHYSRAVEYSIDEINKTATKVWEYRNTPDIAASFMGSAQRLPNGNTLIGWGMNYDALYSQVATEVTSDGQKTIEVNLPNHTDIYMVHRSIFKMNSLSLDVSSPGIYTFNNGIYKTGVTLNLTNISGGSLASVEKHDYAPRNISFSGNPSCNYLNSRWVVNCHGLVSVSGKISIDINSFNADNKNDLRIFYRKTEGSGPFAMLETTYSNSTGSLEANITSFGEFFVGYSKLFQPKLLYPPNDTNNIRLNEALRWSKNSQDERSRIQISKSEQFETVITDLGDLTATQSGLGTLDNFTKYYWRIKLSNYPCESDWSATRSFTTVIGAPAVNYPSDNSTDLPLSGTISWTDINGATSYRVQIAEDSTFITQTVNKVVEGDNTCHYTGLKPLSKFYWRVAAGYKGTYGDWSPIYKFRTSAGTIELTFPEDNSITVSTSDTLFWESISGVNQFRVQIALDSLFAKTVIDSAKIITSYMIFSGLSNTTNYFWRVRGYYKDTSTTWSKYRMFKTVPAVPVLTFPPANSTDMPNSGKLSWKSVPFADSYQVQVSADEKFKNLYLEQTVNTTESQYTAIPFFTKVFWRVRAIDSTSLGNWSKINSFTTHSDLIIPHNDEFAIPVKTSLVWHKHDNATAYDVRIAADSTFTNYVNIFSNVTDTTTIISSLQNNTTYYWCIRTAGMTTPGAWSSIFRFTTQLKKAQLLSPIGIEKNSVASAEFLWKLSEGADFYKIQIALDNQFQDVVFEKEDISENKLAFSELEQDTTYYWRIQSYNLKNRSSWTECKNFEFSSPVFMIFPNGGERLKKASQFETLKWNNNIPNPVKIELLSKGNVVYTVSESYTSDDYQFKWFIPGFIPTDTCYQIKVSNLDNQDLFAISRDYFIINDLTDATENVVMSNNFSITNSPNPFEKSTTFNFTLPQSGTASLKVYNLQGMLFCEVFSKYFEAGDYHIEWTPNLLNEGIYYYVLSSSGQSLIGKFTYIK